MTSPACTCRRASNGGFANFSTSRIRVWNCFPPNEWKPRELPTYPTFCLFSACALNEGRLTIKP